MKGNSKEIKKVRVRIGDKTYPEVSIEKIEDSMKETMLIKEKLYPAIEQKIEEVCRGGRDPNSIQICAICEYYKDKVILDVGSEGFCLQTLKWVSFADTCERWKWDEILY